MATFADLLQVELPDSQAVDSITALPLLKGGDAAYRESHAIFHHSALASSPSGAAIGKLLLHSGSGGNNYAVKSGRRAEAYANTLEQRVFNTGERQLYNLEVGYRRISESGH